MKEYLKIIDEIIALVGLHLIPKFVNLYQGQVDIRCEENDTGVLINIIVSLPDKNELQALQNQVGMDSLQAKQILEGILKLEKMDSCKPLENRQLELKRIWLNKLVSVLEEHMENTEFNVAMLCQLLGMNRKLLYRKIKQLTGVTPDDKSRYTFITRQIHCIGSNVYGRLFQSFLFFQVFHGRI